MRLRALGACWVTLFAFACDATGPQLSVGQVAVDLSTDIATLGAVAFLIHPPSGGAISQVTPASGYDIYQRALPDGPVRVILIGTLSNGELLRFTIPDRSQAANYSLTTEGGADRVTFELVPPSKFVLTPRVTEVMAQ